MSTVHMQVLDTMYKPKFVTMKVVTVKVVTLKAVTMKFVAIKVIRLKLYIFNNDATRKGSNLQWHVTFSHLLCNSDATEKRSNLPKVKKLCKS